ncbi:MAG: YHS domain-containing (seleno)protein, partial [bacterium]
MKLRTGWIGVALAIAGASVAHAQSAGHYALDLAGARKVIAAAEAEATRNGAGPAIAVVDAGGQLVAVARMDAAFPAAARVSIGKANTAATFRKPTRDFENIVNKGRFTMTALPDFTPLMGGVPITYQGQIVGAIGVSGAASADQDDQIAVAGASALETKLSQVAPAPTPTPAPAIAPVSAAARPTAKILVSRDKDGIALQGYDPVAYFTDGKPVKGDPSHSSLRLGAIYRFASAEHKQLFDAAPEKYEPQFGGYCGYAASIDRLSPISPEYFQVLDGRLVLQHNQKALDLWNADLKANLVKADANWPGLVEQNGSGGPWLVNVDDDGVAVLGYDVVAYFADGHPTRGSAANQSTFDGALY